MIPHALGASAPRDTPFDPCLRPASTELAKIVALAVAEVERYETAAQLRTRRRKSADQVVFETTVSAIICGASEHHLRQEPGAVAVARGHKVTTQKSRYKPELLGKTFPRTLDALASPEVGLIEQVVGSRTGSGRQTVIRAAPRLLSLIEQANLTPDDIGGSSPQEVIVLKSVKSDHWDKGSTVEYTDTERTHVLRQEMLVINEWLPGATRCLTST